MGSGLEATGTDGATPARGSMDAIQFETEGPVAIVTINRPQARNAVDGPTAAEPNLNEEKAANTKLNTVALRKGVNAKAAG